MPQVATILQALRSCNIVHHDIKGDNMVLATEVASLLEGYGPCDLRLLDFGFANKAGQYHPSMGGTPGMLSLEVLLGDRVSQYGMDM